MMYGLLFFFETELKKRMYSEVLNIRNYNVVKKLHWKAKQKWN